MTFHDLRATGVTWCAVRGDDPLKIMQRAGHADFETTKVYLREAENLAQGFGVPFSPLPEELHGNRPESPRGDIADANYVETVTENSGGAGNRTITRVSAKPEPKRVLDQQSPDILTIAGSFASHPVSTKFVASREVAHI